MLDLFYVLLVIIFIFFAVSRIFAAKRRLTHKSSEIFGANAAEGSAKVPHIKHQHKVTVTTHTSSGEVTGPLSGLGEEILKSMGSAEAMLNTPAMRDALRDAMKYPGVMRTVTTTTSTSTGSSPFDAAANPFTGGSSPFESTSASPTPPNPAATRATTATVPQGELGIAQVLSAPSLTFDGTRELSLELDAIGEPKRRVTATVPDGSTGDFSAGTRLYVRLDPRDNARVALLSPGESIPVLQAGANRLDPLVLGPQLFRHGSHGNAVIKGATKVGELGGGGSWKLEMEVTPERGWPYRAELLTVLSNPEKTARICFVGAEVPVLYDPDDPKTMCIDSVALGYGNPFQAQR